MDNSSKVEVDYKQNSHHEETVMMKSPKTYEEQVEIIKRKGFIVDDDETCKSFLKLANYYRLSAYFLPFRNADGTYFENINFNRIKRIYEFDGRIRNLIFECIETIELYLRTQLAYYCGHAYGALGYLNSDIYNERHNDDKFKRLLDICIEENKTTLVVQHHKKKYNGQFPVWVIIEFFSMGMLSYLYADLKSPDQKQIARELYHTSSVCLKSWLRCLTYLRNRCAHYSRIYYWSFPALPRMPKNVSFKPNRKLFSQILTLKFLYPDKNEWKSRIMTELRALMEEYGDDISLSHIGFPGNWDEMI